MLKEVVHFNLRICPICGGEVTLVESNYNVYGFNKEGTFTNRKIYTTHMTHLMCTKCDFMIRAEHSILGVIPKTKEKDIQIDESTKYRHLIGYVEE